jgi:hypothetical protein
LNARLPESWWQAAKLLNLLPGLQVEAVVLKALKLTVQHYL